MNVKQFSISALAGGVSLFLLGYLIYVVAMPGYYESNAGSATGVMKEDPSTMPIIFLGQLCLASLITLIYLKWAGIKTFGTGLKSGLLIGILLTLSTNLVMFSTTNIMNFQAAIVDSIVWTIAIGITGGVIGLLLGRIK